jgi:hypothetical protein
VAEADHRVEGASRPGLSPVVRRVVEADFPLEKWALVRELLGEYGQAGWQDQVERVRLAILKLAEGSLDALCQILDQARLDHVDVLDWAETPHRMALDVDADPTEREAAAAEDEQQYLDWLGGYGRDG